MQTYKQTDFKQLFLNIPKNIIQCENSGQLLIVFADHVSGATTRLMTHPSHNPLCTTSSKTEKVYQTYTRKVSSRKVLSRKRS